MNAKICLLLATLWSLWALGEKYAVARVHPDTVQWMCSIPYVVLLPGVVHAVAQGGAPGGSGLDGTGLGRGGVCGVPVGHAPAGLRNADRELASVATAVTSTYPLIVLMLGVLTGEETLTSKRLIGLGLAIGGVIVMQLPER